MRTYTLYWKDEDTNRVRSEEFSNKTGWDHSAMNAQWRWPKRPTRMGFRGCWKRTVAKLPTATTATCSESIATKAKNNC